jgi:hypothetical protein
VAVTALAVAALNVLEVNSAPEVKRTEIKPLVTMHGGHSKITKQRILRITSKEEWEAVWLEHRTGSKDKRDTPTGFDYVDVDFERFMVIAVFWPNRDNCGGFTADSINEDGARITIRLDDHSYQTAVIISNDNPDGGLASLDTDYGPWGVLVLPKSEKEIILELDERAHIRDPAKWTKWKTISPAFPQKRP